MAKLWPWVLVVLAILHGGLSKDDGQKAAKLTRAQSPLWWRSVGRRAAEAVNVGNGLFFWVHDTINRAWHGTHTMHVPLENVKHQGPWYNMRAGSKRHATNLVTGSRATSGDDS